MLRHPADPWSTTSPSSFGGGGKSVAGARTGDDPVETAVVVADVREAPPVAPTERGRAQPAVPWMSVRQERKALQEIRGMDDPHAHAQDVMNSVDMTVEDFALTYVTSHHSKRQQSKKSRSERERLQRERREREERQISGHK